MGPETGLLNAAAQMKTPKVVFLSHSTHENLTRDWTNVHPIWSGNTVCPGRGNNEAPACHQLHYSWEHCKQADDHKGERTGIAQCMFDMDIGEVYKVLWHCIKWAMEAKAA
jgi:ADP-heptose:LPS heptosyltransferase